MPHPRMPGLRVLSLPILLSALLLPGSTLSLAAGETAPPAKQGARKALSLEAWRALKREMEDAMQAPPGPGRIARCEAFLKDHPEFPDPSPLIRTLVDDTVTAGGYDPARLAKLVERTVDGQRGTEKMATALLMVERYCLRYGLPMESAERLLKIAGREMDLQAKEESGNPCPDPRGSEMEENLRARLLVDSARVRLARNDAAGALKLLRAAAEKGEQSGWSVTLWEPGGKQVASLPTGHPSEDWLQLTLAEAQLRSGNRQAARESLARVRNFTGIYDEIGARLEKLHEELGMPAAAPVEVRAGPVPAPDFTLPALEGGKVSLSDYRGKVVLVMLWTTW